MKEGKSKKVFTLSEAVELVRNLVTHGGLHHKRDDRNEGKGLPKNVELSLGNAAEVDI